jgi:regulator of RNase E activity RraB
MGVWSDLPFLYCAVISVKNHRCTALGDTSRTHRGMTQHTNTPVALATCVEQSLHMSLDGFDLKRARLYGISVVDVGGVNRLEDGALRITFLAEHGDVYELIDAPTSAIVRMFDAAVVLTCGWAAPIDKSHKSADDNDDEDDDDANEKLPPSQHPQRRRVRLVVVVGDQGVGSVLRFADTPKEIVTDAGSARGSLADAVNNLWFDSPVHVAKTSR